MSDIEVERKFKPTKEQKDKLITGATSLGSVTNHDTYYDYPDYRLLKNEIRLRSRNGKFELKVRNAFKGDREVKKEEEIKKYFKTELDLKNFIDKNLILLMEYTTEREKYKKGIFEIDIDECDFGFSLCEIEIMVDEENEITDARSKIKEFALKYGLEEAKEIAKSREYLKTKRPDIFKEVYGCRDLKKEIKIK